MADQKINSAVYSMLQCQSEPLIFHCVKKKKSLGPLNLNIVSLPTELRGHTEAKSWVNMVVIAAM